MLRTPTRTTDRPDDTGPPPTGFAGRPDDATRAVASGMAVSVAIGGEPRDPLGGGPDAVVASRADLPSTPEAWVDLLPALPNALDHLDAIATRLSPAGSSVGGAVFLDFDGTLSPIVDRPDDARPAEGVVEALTNLAARLYVAIVSGRGLDDVARRLPIRGAAYAGSHGFELVDWEGTRADHPAGSAALPLLDTAEAALRSSVADLEGVSVDRKRFAVAVHTRTASSGTARALAGEAVADARVPGLVHLVGKEVHELRPDVDWHKGQAVASLLDRLDRPIVPLFAGDDTTDEDGLAEVRRRGGIGIKVTPPCHPATTWAAIRLDDPDAVARLLEGLAGRLT